MFQSHIFTYLRTYYVLLSNEHDDIYDYDHIAITSGKECNTKTVKFGHKCNTTYTK